MITGFENETAPLTESEREAVPYIEQIIKSAVGRDNAVTNKQIIRLVNNRHELKFILREARVRKIINHIRSNDIIPCVIATSTGYYVAQNERELLEYEDSLRARADAIMSVCDSIKRQRQSRFGGTYQPSLF